MKNHLQRIVMTVKLSRRVGFLALVSVAVTSAASPARSQCYGPNCLRPTSPYSSPGLQPTYRHQGSGETFRYSSPLGRPDFGSYQMRGNQGNQLRCNSRSFGNDQCRYQ